MRTAFLLFSALLVPGLTVAADAPLRSRIDYHFVAHLEQTDAAGRTLVWEATADGELSGTMKWWFEAPGPAPESTFNGGRVTYYAARWEFWQDGELAIAGESTGKTDFRDGADGMWDGHGRVTEANGDYADLAGRRVYESGPVLLGDEPPVTFTGSGVFVIF